jgi:hypothetical protein
VIPYYNKPFFVLFDFPDVHFVSWKYQIAVDSNKDEERKEGLERNQSLERDKKGPQFH